MTLPINPFKAIQDNPYTKHISSFGEGFKLLEPKLAEARANDPSGRLEDKIMIDFLHEAWDKSDHENRILMNVLYNNYDTQTSNEADSYSSQSTKRIPIHGEYRDFTPRDNSASTRDNSASTT